MEREKLSVTVITFNEEDNIRDCLESVKWADEIMMLINRESADTAFFSMSPWLHWRVAWERMTCPGLYSAVG